MKKECGKRTVDAFGGNPHLCPITIPCWKHDTKENQEIIKKLAANPKIQKAMKGIFAPLKQKKE